MTAPEGIAQFLNNVWGEETGTVFLATKQGELFKVAKAQNWPEHKENIVQFIMAANTSRDVYFTPGIFKEGSISKEKENGYRAKALWVDVDGYKDGQSGPETASKLLDELGLPQPTYKIQSSNKGAEHWYWILDKYAPAELINEVNRRLAYYLKADTSCWDISHVMRPPFTINHKPKYNRPAVDIIKFTAEVHDIASFKLLPTVKEQLKEIAGKPKELPEMSEVFAKYPWDNSLLEHFRVEGESFYDPVANDYKGRGNSMVSLAFKCAEIGMRDDALYAVLYDVDNRWGKFKDRPDRERRLTEIVAKVRAKYPEGVFATEQLDEDIKQIYGFKEFLQSKFEYKWLVDGLIPANSINFITSRPGVGKSRFTLLLGAQLALGTEFIKWKVVDGPKKVVYFSLEMGPPTLKYFVESLQNEGQYDLDKLDNNFKLVPLGQPLDIANTEGRDFFKMVLDQEKPDVVFIDAMSSLSFEDLGEKTAKGVSNQLKAWLMEYNCTFYIVHHNRKPRQDAVDKAPTEADFFGSTYGTTDAGSVIALWKPNPDVTQIEMVSLKSRIGLSFEPVRLDGSKFIFKKAEGIDDYANGNEQSNAPSEQYGFEFLG